MSHILIPVNSGVRTHENVDDPSIYNLPDGAEVYDSREEFEDRLSDFGDT